MLWGLGECCGVWWVRVVARIVCVEDDNSVREALCDLLLANGHDALPITDFMRTSNALVQDILAQSPDLVLLDLNLPGLDGMVLCRELRGLSQAPIIILTSRSQEIDEVMCMTMGADDFIAKPYSSHVLLARIAALLRRMAGMHTPALERDGIHLDLERSTASYEGAQAELTKNELRILTLLVKRAPAIVSREDLMYELWESDSFIDDNTLTVNINRLRQRLQGIGVVDWLHTHRGRGYSISKE